MPKVYIVGAGPGDPDLLTLKAKRCIENADVILYDALVHPQSLSFAKPSAVCILVGKRKGFHSKKQNEIHDIILDQLKTHETLVRLKGGDPFVFGRGGEECEFLAEHNIPFEVVPGVSALSSVPTYAGIPLTHRDRSRSVAFLTGSFKEGRFDGVEVPLADTLVIFMPKGNLETIVSHLCRLSRYSEKTPAAMIYSGTFSNQHVIDGCLGEMPVKCQNMDPHHPGLLVIGSVCALRHKLDWRKQLPLSGRRIISFRSHAQAASFIEKASVLGAECWNVPFFEMTPNTDALKQLTVPLLMRMKTLVFTSINAVSIFFEYCESNRIAVSELHGLRYVAVGKATADALANKGVFSTIPGHPSSDFFKLHFQETALEDPVLVLGSSESDTSWMASLSERSIQFLPIYTPTIYTPPVPVTLRPNDIVLLTSPHMAMHFLKIFTPDFPITLVSNGPKTTAVLKQRFNGDIIVSKTPYTDSLIQAILGDTL